VIETVANEDIDEVWNGRNLRRAGEEGDAA
jgi:hypothetical protein